MRLRSLGTIFAVALTVAVCAASSAAAAPTVSVRGKIVPIPGFPHTGNILGAGAAVEAEIKISGTEYGGYPAPLIGVNTYLPSGVKLHPQGFKTCPRQILIEEREPRKCPKGSAAGPPGKAFGVVAFGATRVGEETEISSFFAPGGGLEFFTYGHSPVTLEIPTEGKYLHLSGSGGFGPELVAPIPLIETVPGAPDASVERIDVKIGAAYKSHGKTIYYGTVPKTCPRGGFRSRYELMFSEVGGLPAETVKGNITVPCPPHKK